jgi:hypothetical protein
MAFIQFMRDKDQAPESVQPERVVVLRKARGGRENDAQFNEAADAMTWLLCNGKISQWMYDAGMKYRSDVETAQSFRGQDPSKDNVSGGGTQGSVSNGQAMAIDTLAEVHEAVRLLFSQDIWKITREIILRYVLGSKIPASHILMLSEVLEPIAWIYDLAPNGDIGKRLSPFLVNGSFRRRQA